MSSSDEANDPLFSERGEASRFERMQQRELCKNMGFPIPAPEFVGGRYRLDKLLGRGGMGEVYLAWDKELDREVALKLINTSKGRQLELTARLVREAKTLAKLDHPNVVTIHSIETFEDETCVIMAYIRGSSLREWQAGRSQAELLAHYIQAAEGLAAAHELGIVHRDFKPDNVRVGEDGVVRVLDFGIAAAVRGQELDPTRDGDSEDEPSASADADEATILTKAGVAVGTEPYMSPEQLAGRRVDARSDQFSFCVVLWQALCDSHPFPVETGKTRAEAMREAPRGGEGIPRWLQPILARGLAIDPERRYPDMGALVRALASRERRLRRVRVGFFGGAALALSAALGWTLAPEPEILPEFETCAAFEARADGYWDTERALALTRHLAQIDELGSSYVVGELDRLAKGWRADALDNCKGDYAPAEDSEAHRCMSQWLLDFDRAVDRLGEADADALRGAPELLARLTPIAGDYCAIQADPAVAEEVAEPAKLAREAAILGDDESAREQAEDALASARARPGAARYNLEEAEAYAAYGDVLAFASEDAPALEYLERAQAHARATGYHALELRVLIQRIKQASIAGQPELAGALVEQLDPLAELMGLGPEDPRRGEILEARGWYERARGDYEAAIEHHRASKGIFAASERPLEAAKAVFNIGVCQQMLGDYETARKTLERARAMFEAAGATPAFRNYLRLIYQFGLLAYANEANDKDEVREALKAFDTVARHGAPARQLNAMALAISLAQHAGQHADAVARAERALATLAQYPGLGGEAPMNVHQAAGFVLGMDNPERGRALLERAVEDARFLDLESRFLTEQTYIEWLRAYGFCPQLEARLELLEALAREPDAETLGIASWLAKQRTQACE